MRVLCLGTAKTGSISRKAQRDTRADRKTGELSNVIFIISQKCS